MTWEFFYYSNNNNKLLILIIIYVFFIFCEDKFVSFALKFFKFIQFISTQTIKRVWNILIYKMYSLKKNYNFTQHMYKFRNK